MSETTSLIDTAAAVLALGGSQAEIDLLDDDRLTQGMRAVAEHKAQLQRHELWLAAAIARRSDHTLGYQGLARKNGFPTPATFIQSLTGGSLDESRKLAGLGVMVVEAEQAEQAEPVIFDGNGTAINTDGVTPGSSGTAIATAATSGGLNLDCADAIRRGLGRPDAVVTAEQLRVEAEKLIAHTTQASILGSVTPEALLKLARQARTRLDLAAIERGEKERSEIRYTRIWSKDGMSGGSWRLPDEDGGLEIHTALKLLLAQSHGGPRFPQTNSNGEAIRTTEAEAALEDTRTADKILADGFAQIFHNGITADPTVVPGSGRAPVRVIVKKELLTTGHSTGQAPTPEAITAHGSPFLEETLAPISIQKLEEYLCGGGSVDVTFNDDGSIDVGREQRLFTPKQGIALAVRDCGCRFPGCDKPPSWTEKHHIDYWARDGGRTDIINGVLFCRYHHMFIHTKGWEIVAAHGTLWLLPPETLDPTQTLIEMPAKNPLHGAIDTALRTIPLDAVDL